MTGAAPEGELLRSLHKTIRKVTEDIEAFRFNTAVAAIMEMVNELYLTCPPDGAAAADVVDGALRSEALEALTLLLAPFAPHMADELWERLGNEDTVYRAPWPAFDAAAAAAEKSYLDGVLAQLKGAGVNASLEIREGAIAETILATARELNVNLIAMSTHGRTGLRRMLMGSITEGIIKSSPVPVLVVRPKGD